jgi:cytochrome c biogenesis protein
VEFGGLARTDRAGYGEEFDRLTAAVLGTRPDDDVQESRKTEDGP